MATSVAPPGGAAYLSMAYISNPNINGMKFCVRCGHGGCDIRIKECNCSLHARCLPLVPGTPFSRCPQCQRPASGIVLYAMNFFEIDSARKTSYAFAQNTKRGKKRKDSSSGPDQSSSQTISEQGESDCRTGRWTVEETAYCDKLIDKFKEGNLPIVDGTKLNEFLGLMLNSKQSRLTKKMKNANLSAKTFTRASGYVVDPMDCKAFSDIEESYFYSINDPLERAEMRFHMRKEWRELFSRYCVSTGQTLDADEWLCSVEEMDRRASAAKDKARRKRRKLMMGQALMQDSQNPDDGVFIDRTCVESLDASNHSNLTHNEADDILLLFNDKPISNGVPGNSKMKNDSKHSYYDQVLSCSSPFLGKAIAYMQNNGVPFEHIDAWVPSFVPNGETSGSGCNVGDTDCRLCFAGSASAALQQSPNNEQMTTPLTQDQFTNLKAFGEYSQNFSFNIGCGLPGRVYQSGIATWEQSVHNAPHHHFERCGGAKSWGVRTVVGIPVPSPNVGRIVIVMYSCHDRSKDQNLVGKICEELTRLLPVPKWKLVVDMGKPSKTANSVSNESANGNNGDGASEKDRDERVDEMVSLLGEHMPNDPSSSFAVYLPAFMSLRLMLLKPTRKPEEDEVVSTLLNSYSSYSTSGRAKNDIAVMLARDFMYLNDQNVPVMNTNILSRSNHSVASVASAPPRVQSVHSVSSSSFHPGLMMNNGYTSLVNPIARSGVVNTNPSLLPDQHHQPPGGYQAPPPARGILSNGSQQVQSLHSNLTGQN
eukprot:CAMPEP_0197837162 /NCGR_PEP_ID=MMETSP1437-20131217/31319_1 /TAXON_ID=49252 ORGANISM="Eucampia antarctica, Strain CCMP1452" /NCGR_SAMPLE_ID=MMETSP1437 /ASSEMBLY_ACC=CAM_ASM_001096 /LENGTH=763 /DNA_ID=CAMNT_0043443979 /DNA_START=50 /DNA_END=2341 /DNA_ORIENTATION=+